MAVFLKIFKKNENRKIRKIIIKNGLFADFFAVCIWFT